MYLLFSWQEESTHLETFTNLEEATSSFKEQTNEENSKYNMGVALYDLDKSTKFGIGDWGFYGEPIESWQNEDY